MKAACHLVAPAAELSAGVEYCKYDLNRGDPCFVVDACRDTAAVVPDHYHIILLDKDIDLCAGAGKGFINRIVNYLINEVMKASRTLGAYIHSGPFPYGFKTFEYLDLVCAVILGNMHIFFSFGHKKPLSKAL